MNINSEVLHSITCASHSWRLCKWLGLLEGQILLQCLYVC